MFLYDFQNELVVVFVVENIDGGFFSLFYFLFDCHQ